MIYLWLNKHNTPIFDRNRYDDNTQFQLDLTGKKLLTWLYMIVNDNTNELQSE